METKMLETITETTKQIAYSVEQIAQKTTLSIPHLRNEIRAGKLRAKKVGRRVLVLDTELGRYLENQADWSPTAQNGDKN
jgi:excisionase family DNA binding protein